MKNLLKLLFLAPLLAFAQPTPAGGPPAASQAEVDAGVVANKYVSPLTLNNWSGGGGGGAVDSVFGRAGEVVADPADYALYYGQLAAANTWGAVQTFPYSIIRPPTTITVTANSGPLTIENGLNVATNNANTTIVMSAAGTSGQQVLLNAINSDNAASHTWTVDNPSGTDPTFTAQAGSTTPLLLQSNGTVWTIVGGAPTINDLSAATPAVGDKFSIWDVSAGVTANCTLQNISDVLFAQTITNFTVTNLTLGAALRVYSDAAPSTGTAGYTAFDNNAWAASHGALQVYDGTANTYVVAAQASDTPSNGQVPTWNTGGTVTWETPSAGTTVGYTLNFSCGSSAPTGTNTYYFGSIPSSAVTTTAGLRRVYVPKTGTIKVAQFVWFTSGTAGTNESISLIVRLNNSSDTTIASVGDTSVQKVFSNTGLSVAVTAGDYLEIKFVGANWATPPTNIFIGGNLYIE